MTVPETHQRMRVDSDGPLGLNRAVAGAPVSATLRMNEAVAARRAAGQRTIHLGFGEAPFPLPMPLREELARAATRTEYAPVLGLPGLRAAIAAYLARTRGLTASPTTVIVGPGSKAVLYALMRSLEPDQYLIERLYARLAALPRPLHTPTACAIASRRAAIMLFYLEALRDELAETLPDALLPDEHWLAPQEDLPR